MFCYFTNEPEDRDRLVVVQVIVCKEFLFDYWCGNSKLLENVRSKRRVEWSESEIRMQQDILLHV